MMSTYPEWSRVYIHYRDTARMMMSAYPEWNRVYIHYSDTARMMMSAYPEWSSLHPLHRHSRNEGGCIYPKWSRTYIRYCCGGWWNGKYCATRTGIEPTPLVFPTSVLTITLSRLPDVTAISTPTCICGLLAGEVGADYITQRLLNEGDCIHYTDNTKMDPSLYPEWSSLYTLY